MRVLDAVVSLVACTLVVACGGKKPSPPDSGGGGDVIQVSGGERLAWDQRATSPSELAGLRFLLYIDGGRVEFPDTSCGNLTGDQATCSGRLPSMTVGEHTLELSAATTDGTESGRSASLRIAVVRATVGLMPNIETALAVRAAKFRPTSVGGDRMTLYEVVTGLVDPTDLAVVPDGRVLVSERAGRIRVIEGGVLRDEPAVVLDDVQSSPGTAGLLSVVLDPDFLRTRFVYAVYTTDTGFRLARFRETGSRLQEQIVLLDEVPAAPVPSAALRFGPDAKLYLALDDGGEPSRAGDFGSYNGKVLRLNPDGTVPADQAGLTPVFAVNLSAARGFDWDLDHKTLWVAEGVGDQPGVLAALVDEGGRARRGRIVTSASPRVSPPNICA